MGRAKQKKVGRRSPNPKKKPTRKYKTRPGALDEDEEEDALEGSLRWANMKKRLLNAY